MRKVVVLAGFDSAPAMTGTIMHNANAILNILFISFSSLHTRNGVKNCYRSHIVSHRERKACHHKDGQQTPGST